MDYFEAVNLLSGGEAGIRAWNEYRLRNGELETLDGASLDGAALYRSCLDGASLVGAKLDGARLEGIRLTGAKFDGASLVGASLVGSKLDATSLVGANLKGAGLFRASLQGANLDGANLDGARLDDTSLARTSFAGASLVGASLVGAKFVEANLYRANLYRARLVEASFVGGCLDEASLERGQCRDTAFLKVDLSRVRGLDTVDHSGPSSVGVDTLFRSKGRIPEAFLRGCGLAPWEILSAKLYHDAMTPPRFADLQCHIFQAWTKGNGMINGCFISYSWKDSDFVDKLRDRLTAEGVNVWLDRHDMIAGTIQDQVWRAIQLHHVVILVLSEDSVRSDWVENELDMARQKEKAEGRAVLCPIALDDAWKEKVNASGGPGDPSRALWRTLLQKLVMDFSPWKTKAFGDVFDKLVRGLLVNYGPKEPSA